ncbi:hypothetical protein PWG15_31325 (plasmid) [Ensifer adhaerens]|uniref:hypothetical protein n=1 Tax=Ensifer adhaerens TaxID=106592 RepID=UPI0023A9A1E4|nr:hypothetical protein [Ensifer adhaerens]WDZ79918.1 hypothetical protein PWG15_31325 [Ensifer adhaerens]
MTRRTKSRWDKALRTLCAMALFLLGFAHLGPALAAPISATDYALYALPDGSLPDFCQTGTDPDGKEKPAQKHVCSACRFFWALLPPPGDTVGERLQGSLAPLVAVAAVQPATQVHFPNSSPRGPPEAVAWL